MGRLFPMETRALAIAVFYAIGTGIGGIIVPQLFGRLVPTGNASDVFIALAIGAVLMIIGGIVEHGLAPRRSTSRAAASTASHRAAAPVGPRRAVRALRASSSSALGGSGHV